VGLVVDAETSTGTEMAGECLRERFDAVVEIGKQRGPCR
jgi:hypothetical protein